MTLNGLSKMAATALLLVMVLVPAAVAVTYKVGGDSQWDSGVDYTAWVTGKTFRVGDILEFEYGPSHSVDVVDKAGYDNCDGSSATENHTGGDTKIDLKTVGPKYFICPTPGHCAGGMKLAVTVVAASSGTPSTPRTPSTPDSPPAAGTPTTPGSTPGAGTPTTPTPNAGSTSPPPPRANGASKGVMSYVLVGVSLVLGYGLWM